MYSSVFHLYLSPVKRGYCFRFVCLSVCPGRSFSHFVRVTPPTVFITHTPNLYHLKAECLECVMGGPFFRTPKISAKYVSENGPKSQIPIFGASQVKEIILYPEINSIPVPYKNHAFVV